MRTREKMPARLLALPLLAALAAGCGTTTSDLNRLRKETRRLEREAAATEQSVTATRAYLGFVRGSGSAPSPPGPPSDVTAFGRREILRIIASQMPYRFDGRSLDKRLSGNFRLDEPSGLRLLSRNRLVVDMVLTGHKVQVSMKGYAKIKRELKEALSAGIVVEVLVYLDRDDKRNALRLYARANKVTLRKHNSSTYRSQVRSALNSRLFSQAKSIPMPRRFQGRQVHLLTTQNHVVFAHGG